MTRRLAMTAQQLLAPIDLAKASPRRIGTLVAHEGIMLEVSGFPQPLGSNVRIKSANGDYVNGEVVGFRGHRSLVLPFDTNQPLVTGAPVEPHGASSMVPVGKALLGRIIDAQGHPLDGRPPVKSQF
jgi:flagellum-specific ATP synthase